MASASLVASFAGGVLIPIAVHVDDVLVPFQLRQQIGLHGQHGRRTPHVAERIVLFRLEHQLVEDRQHLAVVAQFLVAAGFVDAA